MDLTSDFFSGFAASILSIILASFLVIDYFQSDKLRRKGSGISNKERNLMFFSMFVLLWSSFGALIFSHFEDWTFFRGVYFTLGIIELI